MYEYKCRVCNEHFDVEQSFTDETLTEIDGCSIDESGRHQVKKVFAAPAISFKGDGFYRNDARSSGDASTATTPASDAPSSGSSTDSSPKPDSPARTSSESSSSPAPSNGDKATSAPRTTSSTSSD